MSLRRTKAIVEGRVQGVFFRAYTQEEATRLGLTGWTRNMPDGNVEVLMEGEEEQIQQMIDWLYRGSPMSRVTGVITLEEEPLGGMTDFQIRY